MFLILVIIFGLIIYANRRGRKKAENSDNSGPGKSHFNSSYHQSLNTYPSLSDFYDAEPLSSWENDYVVIDTETTGLSPTKDKLIEVAALKINHGNIVDSYSTLINPGITIPTKITEITGITDEMLVGAPTVDTIIQPLTDFIGNYPIVGHNVTFDIKFLSAARYICGLPAVSVSYIDTLPLARKEFPKLQNHKLSTLISEFELSDQQDHRALSDASYTNQIYQIMRSRNVAELVALPDDVKPFLGIDMAHIVKENEKKVQYNIDPKYHQQASQLILALNPILQTSASLVQTFDPNIITADDILFEPIVEKYIYDKKYDYEAEERQPASYIREQVFTPLGNIKKHPFILNFFTRKHRFYDSNDVSQANEVFGKLFIDKDGNVSRIEIIHWKNTLVHKIYCTKDKNDALTISKIESADSNGLWFVKYTRA